MLSHSRPQSPDLSSNFGLNMFYAQQNNSNSLLTQALNSAAVGMDQFDNPTFQQEHHHDSHLDQSHHQQPHLLSTSAPTVFEQGFTYGHFGADSNDVSSSDWSAFLVDNGYSDFPDSTVPVEH